MISVNLLCLYIQYNPEYLIQNKNLLVIQINHSMLELLFLAYCFYVLFLYIPCVINIFIEEQHAN